MSDKLDFKKMPSDLRVGLWVGPTGAATGIQNAVMPTAAEINASGGVSLMQNMVVATAWQDFDFGVQDPEMSSDPSLADESTYEDVGPGTYGGSISFFEPGKYHDPTNSLSNAYDLTKAPWSEMDVVMRIDGDKTNPTTPAANGDFVHVFRTWSDSETNVMGEQDAYRRTVGFQQAGEAAFYTIVGPHTITAIPPATTPWKAGNKARLRASVGDRGYTSALTFRSSDSAIVEIDSKGGAYTVKGTTGDTATITITDDRAGTSATVAVTVTA